MTRCVRWPGQSGREPHRLCDYCPSEAVFHWRTTYPDLMLCRSCLELYPEALGEPLEDVAELPPIPLKARR